MSVHQADNPLFVMCTEWYLGKGGMHVIVPVGRKGNAATHVCPGKYTGKSQIFKKWETQLFCQHWNSSISAILESAL